MLTQEYIKSILSYDRDTGEFTRIKTKSHLVRLIGKRAGSKREDGYYRIYIDGKRYYLHRLAWLYEYGVLPIFEIDHIDHNKSNNSMANLREVTHIGNMRNVKMHKSNTSGKTGVSWNGSRNKWIAQIYMNDKTIFLGRFDNKDDAISARDHANETYGFHVNHGV